MRTDTAAMKKWLGHHRLPVLIGLFSGVLAMVLLQQERAGWQAAAGEGARQPVVLLGRMVPADQTVETGWLRQEEVPVPYIHPLAVRPDEIPLVGGMRAQHELRSGQPLLWSDLAPPEELSGEVAGLVRPNERAISLRVNEVSGVGRLIRNNDHIDIFGTFQRPEGVVTIPVLQNVVVVATGRSVGGGGGGNYNTLSVSVSPQNAGLLTLAQETGRLTYVLRNNLDFETVGDLQRISLADLFEEERRKKVQESHNQHIRVLRGRF